MWVYDRGLRTGQFVKSVDEIDLEAEKTKKKKPNMNDLRRNLKIKKATIKAAKQNHLQELYHLGGRKTNDNYK